MALIPSNQGLSYSQPFLLCIFSYLHGSRVGEPPRKLNGDGQVLRPKTETVGNLVIRSRHGFDCHCAIEHTELVAPEIRVRGNGPLVTPERLRVRAFPYAEES